MLCQRITGMIMKDFLQIGVIPARFQSVRFPGKPLVKILGVPMVVRTWQQACLCKTLSKVIVATDDERIAEACRQEGAEVVMTSVSCANGAAHPSADGLHGAPPQQTTVLSLLQKACLRRGIVKAQVWLTGLPPTVMDAPLSCRYGEVS